MMPGTHLRRCNGPDSGPATRKARDPACAFVKARRMSCGLCHIMFRARGALSGPGTVGPPCAPQRQSPIWKRGIRCRPVVKPKRAQRPGNRGRPPAALLPQEAAVITARDQRDFTRRPAVRLEGSPRYIPPSGQGRRRFERAALPTDARSKEQRPYPCPQTGSGSASPAHAAGENPSPSTKAASSARVIASLSIPAPMKTSSCRRSPQGSCHSAVTP